MPARHATSQKIRTALAQSEVPSCELLTPV